MNPKCILPVVAGFLLFSVAAGEAGPRPNPHNDKFCIVCHKETPRFGVDTRQTVTFRDAGPDDPALCARCHKPEVNLHPVKVKPGNLGTTVSGKLPLGSSAGLEGMVTCTTCHFVHAADADHALLRGFAGSPDPGTFGGWQDLCRSCHATGLEKRSPHAGDDRSCAFCHGAKPVAGKPVAVAPRGEALCNFCHGVVQADHVAQANPFGPGAGCTECHEPHGAPKRAARLTDRYLAAARESDTLDPHYRKALCFACHKDEKDSPLLTADPIALCNRCHGTGRIPGDPHPLKAVPPGIKVPAGWPLREGALTCLTCHRNGHAEDRGHYRFLRGGPYENRNDICFGCHDREQFRQRNPHQDINQYKGCDFCHSVRPIPGKDTARTVKFLADINILCLRCHADQPHPAGRQHTMDLDPDRAAGIPPDYPLDAMGKITCATCHNPHIAEVGEYKLRGTANGMGICDKCHGY